MVRSAIGVLALGVFLTLLSAGEFNKRLSLGDAAPAFSKLPGVDGKDYSLDSFKDKDVFVLVIMSNRCPVSQDYEDRLIAFANKYGGDASKVGILAVNVDKEELLPQMKKRAQEKGFNFPYVLDETQQLARDVGATVTPEFFVFNKDRKLVYMGAMDDDQIKPKVNYLEPAVEATLKGEKVEKPETRPHGCGVEYKTATPDVELKTVKYDALKAAVRAQHGKVVVVDIWADFCIPCKKAFPHLLEMQHQYEKQGLVCMTVTIDKPEERDTPLKFLRKQKATIANYLLDEPQAFWQEKFEMNGPPVVFVFDRQGKRAAKFDNSNLDNAFTPADVEKLVQQLLKDR
jgi:thiol-disulfide isomerase/thioredoxin